MKKNIKFIVIGWLLFGLSACQTVQFDSKSNLLLALPYNAPKVAIVLNDSRSTAQVGNVGGLIVKCPKSTAEDYMSFNLKRLLGESGVQAVFVEESIGGGDPILISKIAKKNNARGVIYFDLARISGSSFDETISPPDYISEGLFVAYDDSGSKYFSEQLSGVHTSSAIMTSSKSEALQQSVLMMFSQLHRSSKYDQWLQTIKK